MRLPSRYENYINDEWDKYDIRNSPIWIEHELKAYNRLLETNQMLDKVREGSCTSKDTLEWLAKEAETPCDYEDISPVLRSAVEKMHHCVAQLYADLMSDESYWRNPHTLSKKGRKRWNQTCLEVPNARKLVPDTQYRHTEN